jgi:hypothetical protein
MAGQATRVLRTELDADAPLALFYGEGAVLEQRELLEASPGPDGLSVRFRVDGGEASATIATGGRQRTGTLLVAGVERRLQQGVRSPLGLGQLELRCSNPAPEAWLSAGAPPPEPAPSCSAPLPIFACAVTTGVVIADIGPTFIPASNARVVELGSGLSADFNATCLGRVTTLADDARVNLRWARFEHPGGQLWIAAAGPELELPLVLGQLVDVTSWENPSFGWETWEGELTIRSAAGETLLWMAQVDDYAQLSGTPELDLLPGPERCITAHECGGAVSRYALAARLQPGIGADGLPRMGSAPLLVGYGERAQLGDYSVYNGGIEAQTAAPSCFYKGGHGNARIAIWKAPDN